MALPRQYFNIHNISVLFLASNKDVNTKTVEHLKTVASGAAPLPKSDADRLLEKLQVSLLLLY